MRVCACADHLSTCADPGLPACSCPPRGALHLSSRGLNVCPGVSTAAGPPAASARATASTTTPPSGCRCAGRGCRDCVACVPLHTEQDSSKRSTWGRPNGAGSATAMVCARPPPQPPCKHAQGDIKSPLEYCQEAAPIKVSGAVVASYGSEWPLCLFRLATGCGPGVQSGQQSSAQGSRHPHAAAQHRCQSHSAAATIARTRNRRRPRAGLPRGVHQPQGHLQG